MKREGYCICICMRVMAAECPGDSKERKSDTICALSLKYKNLFICFML